MSDDSPPQEKSKKAKKKKSSWILNMIIVSTIIVAGFAMLFFVVTQLSKEQKKPEAAPEQSAGEGAAGEGAEGQAAGGEGAGQQEEMPKVKVYKVGKENFIHIMETLGTVRAKSKVDLRFEVNGIIDSINVKEADQVREDDVVAEISHEDAELKVDFRKSKYKEAQIEEKNWRVKNKQNKELLEAGAITQAKFDEGKFAHQRAKQAAKSAKIELKSAEAELEKTYLINPIDGIVGEIESHKGEFVSSQKKIMSIMEISEVLCEFSVLEKDIQDVKEDLNIKLTVDTYPGEKFSGTISQMGTIVDTVEGRSRKVKAVVPNDDHKLLPGMFSHVEVILFQRENAMCIPVSCFPDIDQDTSTVWVIGEGDKVQKKQITVEHFNNEKALVENGLKIGDLVVIDVATVKLQEAKQVEIVEVKEPEAK